MCQQQLVYLSDFKYKIILHNIIKYGHLQNIQSNIGYKPIF